MDARAQRGLEIATHKSVKKRGNLWIVPSQSGDDPYEVDYDAGHCTCPDHTIRQKKCKHLYAVDYTIQQQTTTETAPDGTTTTTRTITKTKRVTYKQNWTVLCDGLTRCVVVRFFRDQRKLRHVGAFRLCGLLQEVGPAHCPWHC